MAIAETSGPSWLSSVPDFALERVYRTQQAAIRRPLVASHALLRWVGRSRRAPPDTAIEALRREYDALLERDLGNARQGFYPPSLLFSIPWLQHARRLPHFFADMPRVVSRSRRGDFEDVPDTGTREFPRYFRRTFHWQTDGYLSRRSARLYDVSVEFLFLGCADVMRRQVIPPMVRFAGSQAETGRPLRILDVGCGTGRTLAQIAAALPDAQRFGLDLSPWYLEEARSRLVDVPELSLVCEGAESLPFRDDYFDIVTSVFLFHELPRRVRRRVMAEMARVLRPGGLLVIADSAQLAEARDLAPFLRSFAAMMHEPYYAGYLRDDLEGICAEAGLEVQATERAWLSKVVTGRAPGRSV